jgi:hypothetical protein
VHHDLIVMLSEKMFYSNPSFVWAWSAPLELWLVRSEPLETPWSWHKGRNTTTERNTTVTINNRSFWKQTMTTDGSSSYKQQWFPGSSNIISTHFSQYSHPKQAWPNWYAGSTSHMHPAANVKRC